MKKLLIEVITCESGDWEVLKVDGKIEYEGHDIPEFVWMTLIEKLGHTADPRIISDEDMENGNY
jgi:hypothetical protein